MKAGRLTIGELSRRTGVPVKTLRFWSDEGLLPPASRSASGYRLYSEEAVVRLDLVRALRDAGLSLADVRRVLRRDLSLRDALRLHLTAVEAQAASLQRVAAALRAALRREEPDESDVRRLCAVTRWTNEQRRALIERFHERVSEGIPVDEAWRKKMVDASAPKLPDDASPAQLDAWIELAELVSDPTFVERLRASTKEVWTRGLDQQVFRETNERTAAAAAAARARGDAPSSPAGRELAEAYVAGVARASGKAAANADLRRDVRAWFAGHDPRASRYWELVAIMNGPAPAVGNVEDWRFVAEAILAHLPGS